ncbi:MAG: hypothetical protein K8H87_10865 [Pseudorhodoplanes sp.]|nr:hypothetical protein [Pseudorhodoplanes sp.]
MVQVIRQTDIADMLTAFEASRFQRFTLRIGTTQISARRKPAAMPPARSDTATEETVTVVAPLLGTFQSGDELRAKPLVAPGDRIENDTVIGTIRVRRTVTPVFAGRRGTVVAVLVKDGTFVEHGQALLEVRPLKANSPRDIR